MSAVSSFNFHEVELECRAETLQQSLIGPQVRAASMRAYSRPEMSKLEAGVHLLIAFGRALHRLAHGEQQCDSVSPL